MSPEPSENHVSLSNLLRHKTLPRLLNSSVDVSLAATHGKEAVPGSNPFHGKPSKLLTLIFSSGREDLFRRPWA